MQFRDVIGQQGVKRSLLTMADEGRTPHAMLFVGGEGCGSLPLALAFAQYINCTGDKSAGDSCGECPSCKKTAKMVHPDVHCIFPIAKSSTSDDTDTYLPDWRGMVTSKPYFGMQEWIAAMARHKSSGPAEMDEADDKKSSTGKQALIAKDAATTIHHKLSMKPYEAERQIMIIWRPELMNETTSNSILKILEEPPQDTIFMMVSEEPQKILPTIMSRTQTFRVPPIGESDMTDAISKMEGLSSEEAGRVAHIAQGNYVAALRQLSSAAENDANLAIFKDMMRAAWQRDVIKMNAIAETCRAMTREQAKGLLTYCQHLVRESFVMNLGRPEINFLTAGEEAFLVKFAPFIHVANVEKISALIDDSLAKVEQNGNIRMIIKGMVLSFTAFIRTTKRPSAEPEAQTS